jgi:hypothetical protein
MPRLASVTKAVLPVKTKRLLFIVIFLVVGRMALSANGLLFGTYLDNTP